MMHDILFRMRALFRRGAMEAELDEELRAHLEHQTEKLMQLGLPREDAEMRARFDFGDLDLVKAECRTSWGVRLVDELAAEIRAGLCEARRKPAFSTLFALALVLGLLANTMMFDGLTSVVERLSPRPHTANPALAAGNSVPLRPPLNKSGARPGPVVRKLPNKKLSRARAAHKRDETRPERLASAAGERVSIVTAACFYTPGAARLSAAKWMVRHAENSRNGFVLISRAWRQAGSGARLEAQEMIVHSGGGSYIFVEVIAGSSENPQLEGWSPLVLNARAATSHSAQWGAQAVTQSGPCASVQQSLSKL